MDNYIFFKNETVLLKDNHFIFSDKELPFSESIAFAPFVAVEVAGEKEASFVPLRELLGTLDNKLASILLKAKGLLHWHRHSLYCSCCGSPTEMSKSEIAKICEKCKNIFYPVISPVVMVLIVRDKEILLARSPHFPKGWYSTIAGFVEVGETLESAIGREVAEEVGVTIKNISYFGSQSWPFPSSLLLAFIVEYDAGEIKIDGKEIEDARWFNLNNLPPLPPSFSISRQLIDSFIAQKAF